MSAKAKSAPTVKDQIKALLDKLPDTCTVEDVQYQLYVIDKINRGEKSLREANAISPEEIRKRFTSCPTE